MRAQIHSQYPKARGACVARSFKKRMLTLRRGQDLTHLTTMNGSCNWWSLSRRSWPKPESRLSVYATDTRLSAEQWAPGLLEAKAEHGRYPSVTCGSPRRGKHFFIKSFWYVGHRSPSIVLEFSRCLISNRQRPYRISSRCTRISYTTIHQAWKS